jgi:thymidylate synthase ThyX
MDFYAKIIADSVSDQGKRITTMELCYPRFIHGEVMTHRVFSRNAMSSRAIPVAKMIEQVRNSPAMPVHWGKNQPGMQANEQLEGLELKMAKCLWQTAAYEAAKIAERMNEAGVHKQVANRILEPFQWMRTIVTSTEWDNFFELRCHPDAQPEFQKLARLMQDAMEASEPTHLQFSEWHMPYVVWVRDIYGDQRFEANLGPIGLKTALKVSTARCARVSYLTHDGKAPDVDKDIELYERLVGSVPLHASPAEHQAMASHDKHSRSGNFRGWLQHRQTLENEIKTNRNQDK